MLETEFMKLYEELDKINKDIPTEEILNETNKIVRRFANNGWYSGYASGLNDIDNRAGDKELELKAKAEEERKRKEAEAKAKREEAAKQAQLQLAQQAIDTGTWDEYNKTHKYNIRRKDWCPAIDPDTQQLVYDVQRKEEILRLIDAQLNQERAEQRRIQQQKDAEIRAKERADAAITYCWRASATINGKTGYTNYRHIVGNDNPEAAAKEVLQKEIDFLREEQKECRAFGEPFNWDGKVTIYCKDPTGKEEVYKVVSFKRK